MTGPPIDGAAPGSRRPVDQQALIFAPRGRDVDVANAILAEAGIAGRAVATVAELIGNLRTGAAFALVTEEAFQDADLRELAGWLAAQPEWSDFPFILLTQRGGGLERNPQAARLLDTLGNVTFLERPFHPTTLTSLSKAALRARRRQYDARARIDAIRQTEEQLRLAISAGKLGAWALVLPAADPPPDDVDKMRAVGPTLQMSALCKAHYGRAADDAFDFDDLLGAVHPDDQPRVRAAMTRALTQGGDYDVDYRCRWPDGSIHWVQVRGQLDRTGQSGLTAGPTARSGSGSEGSTEGDAARPPIPLRMSGVTLDITERKAAEVALWRSEARFRAAVEAVKGVVWTNDTEGRMIGEQPGWAALTGQHRDDYQGYGWAAAIHPDDAGPTVDGWNAAVAERRSFEFEHRVRRRDGSWGQFAVRAIPALEDDGSIREWVGVHTDITEQRRAERQLAELAATLEQRVIAATHELTASRARLRSIFETSYQYFGELCPAGRIVDANATSLSAIGMELDDVTGTLFSTARWFSATPGMSDLIADQVRRAAQGTAWHQEIAVDLPSGLRTLDCSIRPVRDGAAEQGEPERNGGRGGAVVAIIFEAMDITERRHAEEHLRQSQKLETIGQLTGGVAHDFNNLLTPIVGSLDLLRRKLEGDERAQRMAAAGLQSAERAKTLIDRLLAFARRQTLDPRPVDVGALVASMRELIERSIGPSIAVVVDAPPALPPALVDPNQLELSILNLCVNARDAMPDGGAIAIALSRTEDGDGAFVRLTVTDTGTGMDPETARRAIEPFYTTKEIGKGTGLGLSMVHGLTAQLGGRMDITSSPGAGTTITLLLPVASGPVELPVAPRPRAHDRPSGSSTILLVDDEELVRFTAADTLREAGYLVVEAASGREARALVDKGLRPDILVTDQLMPEMKGTELAEALQAALPTLHVLIATGFADLPDVAWPRISKPFGSEDLIERVAALAGRST